MKVRLTAGQVATLDDALIVARDAYVLMKAAALRAGDIVTSASVAAKIADIDALLNEAPLVERITVRLGDPRPAF